MTWALVVLFCGCGTPTTGSDAGDGADAASVDGGVVEDEDAASDAGVTEDAAPDGDGDGVPTPSDCDDTDSSVGSASSEPCESACGAGERTCTDGVWSECSAPTDCVCTTEGEMRNVPCGDRCGERFDRCVSGRWELGAECLYEGECSPATVEMRDDPRCGESSRACSDTCEWRDWEITRPPGACTPGTRACVPPSVAMRCNDMCMWETLTDC